MQAPVSNHITATVDEHGRLILPAEAMQELGLKPGSAIPLRATREGLVITPSVSQLRKLYIEPTTRCNLACPMCIRESWSEAQGNMTEETFGRVLDGLRSLERKPVIVFGGFGEPLFHPRILDMLAQAKQVAERVELITNGLLVTEPVARELFALQLDVIWFSVDRLHAGAPGNDGNLLENIQRLQSFRMAVHAVRPETGFVFVATQTNVDELPSLIQRAVRWGVSRYMVTNVLPYTEAMCGEMLYERSLDQIGTQPSFWSPAIQLPRMDVDLGYSLPLLQALRRQNNVHLNGASLTPSRGQCPFIESGAAAVCWDGTVSPCLGLMHSHTSYFNGTPPPVNRYARAVSRYAIGNVNEMPLLGIWNDADHLAFRKRVQEFDFPPCTQCGGCDMAEANQEDCFGNSFPTCGGCLWAWGVIQCP